MIVVGPTDAEKLAATKRYHQALEQAAAATEKLEQVERQYRDEQRRWRDARLELTLATRDVESICGTRSKDPLNPHPGLGSGAKERDPSKQGRAGGKKDQAGWRSGH